MRKILIVREPDDIWWYNHDTSFDHLNLHWRGKWLFACTVVHATTWQTTSFHVSTCETIFLSGQNLCHKFVTEWHQALGLWIDEWITSTKFWFWKLLGDTEPQDVKIKKICLFFKWKKNIIKGKSAWKFQLKYLASVGYSYRCQETETTAHSTRQHCKTSHIIKLLGKYIQELILNKIIRNLKWIEKPNHDLEINI